MGRTRAPYPAAFRQQIVELARTGKTPAELSREFGPTGQTIANWVAQDARGRGTPLPGKEGLSTEERQELARLRRKLRQVEQEEQERDILVKARVCSPPDTTRRLPRLRADVSDPGRTK